MVFCFEQVNVNVGRICNQETSTTTLSYYKLLISFDLISALAFTKHILDLTLPLTKSMEVPAIDVGDSSYVTESLKSLINS